MSASQDLVCWKGVGLPVILQHFSFKNLQNFSQAGPFFSQNRGETGGNRYLGDSVTFPMEEDTMLE